MRRSEQGTIAYLAVNVQTAKVEAVFSVKQTRERKAWLAANPGCTVFNLYPSSQLSADYLNGIHF